MKAKGAQILKIRQVNCENVIECEDFELSWQQCHQGHRKHEFSSEARAWLFWQMAEQHLAIHFHIYRALIMQVWKLSSTESWWQHDNEFTKVFDTKSPLRTTYSLFCQIYKLSLASRKILFKRVVRLWAPSESHTIRSSVAMVSSTLWCTHKWNCAN